MGLAERERRRGEQVARTTLPVNHTLPSLTIGGAGQHDAGFGTEGYQLTYVAIFDMRSSCKGGKQMYDK